MTPIDAVKKLDGLMLRKQVLAEKIVEASRPIIPVLLDAGRANSAKALQELLFEFDAIAQEATDIINADPRTVLAELLRRRGVA